MAIVKVQSTSAGATGGLVTCQYASAVTVGNVLIAIWAGDDGSTSQTFSNDGTALTWNAGFAFDGTATGIDVRWAVATAAEQMIVTADPTTSFNHLHIFEYSGLVITSVVDQTGGEQASGNVSVDTAGSVAQAEELVLVCVADWNTTHTITAGTGYTLTHAKQDTGSFTSACEDNDTRTGLSGVQTGTATWTGAHAVVIVTFKATVAGGAAPKNLTLLGVG